MPSISAKKKEKSLVKSGFLLTFSVIALAVSAAAQQSDRVELFGGYSRVSYPIGNLYSGPFPRAGFNGWEASAAARVTPHLSFEADFGGGSTSTYSTSLKTYMGGPRFSADFNKIGIFGHVLFGALNVNRGFPQDSATSFAVALGGGVNYWFGRHWGVRLGQVDYIRNTNSAASFQVAASQPSADFRISTGVAFRF